MGDLIIPYERCFQTKTREEEEEEERTYQRYRDFISSLPEEKGWIGEKLYRYQGFWHRIETGAMAVQEHFKAYPSDILLATTQKCGTTWLKALIFATANRKLYPNPTEHHPLLTLNPHYLVPSLEQSLYKGNRIPNLEHLPQPRLLSTHMPYNSLPESVIDFDCQTVYLCRDPKDTFVSLWHFNNKIRSANSHGLLPLEEAFELFCKGVCLFGPFWDHVLGYWKASLERPQSILFLKYEQLQTDPIGHVRKLAEFMKCPFSSEEERNGVVEDIVKLCSFENLSTLEVNTTKKMPMGFGNNAFFRQGKVGDWTNHLTPEMTEQLDRITEHKLHGYDLTFS